MKKNMILWIMIIISMILIGIGITYLIVENRSQKENSDLGQDNNYPKVITCKKVLDQHTYKYTLYVEKDNNIYNYDFILIQDFKNTGDYYDFMYSTNKEGIRNRYIFDEKNYTVTEELKNQKIIDNEGNEIFVSLEWYQTILEDSGYSCQG